MFEVAVTFDPFACVPWGVSFLRATACVFSIGVGQAGVGVLAPIAALQANPLPNAVAVVSLEDTATTGGQVSLPQGVVRLAVSLKVSIPCSLMYSNTLVLIVF